MQHSIEQNENKSPINYENIRNHIIAWVIFYSVDFGFLYTYKEGVFNISDYIFNLIFNTTFFYVIIYFLNKPYKKKNVLQIIYFLLIIITIAIAFKYFYDIYVEKNRKAIETSSKNIFSYISYEIWRLTTMTFYAFAYLTYLRSVEHQKTILETERKLLVTEIAFLKAQINPHFLFNTLNFVYQDVCSISPNSGDTILNLADMMRYSVRSTKMDFAPLINEVEAIDKYIYLQRKRFGDKMYVDFHKIGNLNNVQIPPLIMLSLVENAFKYGVYFEEENPIEIIVEVNEKEIIFNCSNKIRENYKETETNAVGITNIKRRLEITYENNFELDNWIENKNYFVHLKIFSNTK